MAIAYPLLYSEVGKGRGRPQMVPTQLSDMKSTWHAAVLRVTRTRGPSLTTEQQPLCSKLDPVQSGNGSSPAKPDLQTSPLDWHA